MEVMTPVSPLCWANRVKMKTRKATKLPKNARLTGVTLQLKKPIRNEPNAHKI